MMFRGDPKLKERGQSLVELALVLPFLLFLTAAALEIGNVLAIYVQMENAAREGTRLGAQGLPDPFIGDTIGQQLDDLQDFPNDLRVWVVRPIIVEDGGGTIGWLNGGDGDWGTDDTPEENPIVPNCVLGRGGPIGDSACPGDQYSEDDPDESDSDSPAEQVIPITSDQILDQIAQTGVGGLGTLDGQRVTIVAMYYEINPILNLPFYPMELTEEGFLPVSTYTVMRQEVSQSSIDILVGGCSAYPIAISSAAIYSGDVLQIGNFCEGQECDLDLLPISPRPTTNDDGFFYLAWNENSTAADDLVHAMLPPGTSNLDPP
ncbi:MAG: pilus assembly protein, partial [Chloroflexi bacterium]|nr:pilus assembly protein [Chloroflexota bacterium]